MYDQKDTYYMQLALKEAQKAGERGEVPIGAIIVAPHGEILGVGYNQTETLNCQDQHAEMNAIRQASQKLGDWRLDGCALYVTLEPCIMCCGCIALSRIERLVYAAESPLFGYHMSREATHEISKHLKNVTAGVCAAEAQQLLQQFFKTRRAS